MNIKLKGSSLIVALMIVLILVIMGVGQLVLVNHLTNAGGREQVRNQLYWAAEAGANHAYTALDQCASDTKNNLDNKAADAAADLTAKLKDLSFGRVKTNVTVEFNSPKWNITSVASLDGKTCTVKINDIVGIPPLDFPMIMHKGMEGGRGLDPGTNMFGKSYFGGFVNPTTYEYTEHGVKKYKTPVFHGPVISSATTASEKSSYYKGFIQNEDNSMSKFLENGDYAAGLHLSNRMLQGGGNNTQNYTKEAVLERANTIFPAGYKAGQALPVVDSLTYTWDKFNACTENVTRISVSNPKFAGFSGKDVKVVFSDKKATFYKKTAANTSAGDGTGSDISKYDAANPVVIDLSTANKNGSLLLIDKDFGTVFIEGNIGASTTMVTEASNVVISDDLYYTGLESKTWDGHNFKDIPTSVYQDPEKAKSAFLAMQAEVNKVETKFAVLAGLNTSDETKSRISISPTSAVNNPDQSVFLTGAYFSKSGRFGIESYKSGSGDNDDQNYWQVGGKKIGQIAVVNIGCMAFKTKGKYSQEYKSESDKGMGIVQVFGTDLRYVNGDSPFGFRVARFGDKKRWSVKWN